MAVLRIAQISLAAASFLILVLSVIYISVCGFQVHETKVNIARFEKAIQQKNESWADDITKKCNTSDLSDGCYRFPPGRVRIAKYCDCRRVRSVPRYTTYQIGNCTYDGQTVHPEQLNVILKYRKRLPAHMNNVATGIVSITCGLLGLLVLKRRGLLTLLLILVSGTMVFYHRKNIAEARRNHDRDCLPIDSSQSIVFYNSILLIVLLLLQGIAGILLLGADIGKLFEVETEGLDDYNRLEGPENQHYKLYYVILDLFEPLRTPKRLLDIGSVFLLLGLSSLALILASCNICPYCATDHPYSFRVCNIGKKPLLGYNALVVVVSLAVMACKVKFGNSFENRIARRACLGGWALTAAALTFNILCIIIATNRRMRYVPEYMIVALLTSQTFWLAAAVLYLGLFPVKQLFKVIINPFLGFLYSICLLPCLAACIRPIAVKVINDLQLEEIIREERAKTECLVEREESSGAVREEPQGNVGENC